MFVEDEIGEELHEQGPAAVDLEPDGLTGAEHVEAGPVVEHRGNGEASVPTAAARTGTTSWRSPPCPRWSLDEAGAAPET